MAQASASAIPADHRRPRHPCHTPIGYVRQLSLQRRHSMPEWFPLDLVVVARYERVGSVEPRDQGCGALSVRVADSGRRQHVQSDDAQEGKRRRRVECSTLAALYVLAVPKPSP